MLHPCGFEIGQAGLLRLEEQRIQVAVIDLRLGFRCIYGRIYNRLQRNRRRRI